MCSYLLVATILFFHSSSSSSALNRMLDIDKARFDPDLVHFNQMQYSYCFRSIVCGVSVFSFFFINTLIRTMHYVLVYCRWVFNTSTYILCIVHIHKMLAPLQRLSVIVVYELIFCFHYIMVCHIAIFLYIDVLCPGFLVRRKKKNEREMSDSYNNKW